MSKTNLPRVNFFDGMNITETDLDAEQTAWHDTLADNIDFLAGSGVEQEFAVQRILFDSDNVPASVVALIDSGNFDGEPIYEKDVFDQQVFLQPSDQNEGNALQVEISDSNLAGSFRLKVYLFGQILGGAIAYEVLTFNQNESQITRQYFTNILSIMTQDFKGNQNIIIDGTPCRNAGGRLRVLESLPMTVVRDPIMAEQAIQPNLDFVDFKPATMSKTLESLLEEIAAVENLNAAEFNITVTAAGTRELPANESGLIIGQKFQATTNNIQKISTLIGVTKNSLALSGHEYDWTGDIVVGIRKLQATTNCPTDTIPGTFIEFDPEPSPLAEVSFSMAELLALGIVLTDTPQVVDFVFTQSLLANPSVAPDIEVGQYYIITIRRSGNISEGTLVLPEASNVASNSCLSVFLLNKWTDVPDSDLWFKVHTSAVRITNGAVIDNGVRIISPKTQENSSTGVDEPYVEGRHSLLDTSSSTSNYVIVQKANSFTVPIPHPATGNLVATRIVDIPGVSVVLESTLTTLIDAGNKTVILGSAKDTNPVGNPPIMGVTQYAGLLRQTTFTIINPTSDLWLNNLVGSILTPNVDEQDLRYRIISAELFTDAYGDVTGDTFNSQDLMTTLYRRHDDAPPIETGVIDLNDVARAQFLDGYAKNLTSGTIPSIHQRAAIVNGTVTMEEILRADVTGDGVINIYDPQAIQQHIALGTAFDAGSSFKRMVLTVENIINPLTTTPNMIAADPLFNNVPFSELTYQIDFVPLWEPENIVATDLRRFVPKTFAILDAEDIASDAQSGGTNTAFLSGDVLIGGDILNLDGTPYSVDFEIGHIVLDLPEGSTQGEIDIFNNFIKNKMMFGDGSFVTSGALERSQIRITASIQSFAKDFPPNDGYDFESNDGYAAVKETVCVLYTQESGVIRIRANNIRNLTTRPEVRTKIILTVYLKKSGFYNLEEAVPDTKIQELLIPV